MPKSAKVSDLAVNAVETSPRITPARKKLATGAKRIRTSSPSRLTPLPEPHLLALLQSSHGRELIWERDPVLDNFLESAPREKPLPLPKPWTKEQEELSEWFAEHGEELPEELTLWPHVKVHKHSFLRSIQEGLQQSRRHADEPPPAIWRLLRRVQVVMTAQQCVHGV